MINFKLKNMELKANELRLGNYIYKFGIDYIYDNPIVDRNDREIIEVYLSVLKNIIDYDGTTDFYYTEPIPLTEEILLKCGFKRRYNAPAMILNYGELQSVFTINIVGDKFHFTYGDLEIQYLHQLQNLYFALTNEELNINL